MITKKEIHQYKSYTVEIEALQIQIKEFDILKGLNHPIDSSIKELLDMYQSKIEKAEKQRDKIKQFLDSIQDADLHQSFLLWTEGKPIREITQEVYHGYYADGSIKNKMYRYIDKYNKEHDS